MARQRASDKEERQVPYKVASVVWCVGDMADVRSAGAGVKAKQEMRTAANGIGRTVVQGDKLAGSIWPTRHQRGDGVKDEINITTSAEMTCNSQWDANGGRKSGWEESTAG